jgi:hypothetical protein
MGIKMLKKLLKPKPSAPRVRYRCPSCTKKHDGFPAAAFRLPDVVHALAKQECADRAIFSSDLCVLDGNRHFVRGVMSVNVVGYSDIFEYGPWIEIDAGSFVNYAVACHAGGKPGWKSVDGRLANALPASPHETLGLACSVRISEVDEERPWVDITDQRHPLYREQIDGISIHRAMELVAQLKGFILLVD